MKYDESINADSWKWKQVNSIVFNEAVALLLELESSALVKYL